RDKLVTGVQTCALPIFDRMRSARIQRAHFEPREGFDPHEFRDARPARIWYSKKIARWEIEKGAHPLSDGTAAAEKPVGSAEWLRSEERRVGKGGGGRGG